MCRVGTAWAITKALLPLRLVLSVWATPWFARTAVIPITNAVKRVFRRGGSRATTTAASAAAGTGAVSGGAVPKQVKPPTSRDNMPTP